MTPTELAELWSCLHDGSIAKIRRTNDGRSGVVIECLYIAGMLGNETDLFLLEVDSPLTWKPWDAELTMTLDELAAMDPTIMSGEVEEDLVRAVLLLDDQNSGGELWMSASRARLIFAGKPLTIAALQAATKAYWDAAG